MPHAVQLNTQISKNLQQRLDHIGAVLARVFAPGTRSGDVLGWLSRRHPQEREAALESLAGKMVKRWRPGYRGRKAFDWRVTYALRTLAWKEGDWQSAKVQALKVGILLALGEINTPQRIKIGQQYVRLDDSNGGPSMLRPGGFAHPGFFQWLHRRAIVRTEDWLLDQLDEEGFTFPHRREGRQQKEGSAEAERQRLRDKEAAEQYRWEEQQRQQDLNPNLLDALIAAEENAERASQYRALLDNCTPDQREILELLRHEIGSGKTLPEAKKAVAAHRDTDVAAIGMTLHRVGSRVAC